MSIKNKKIFHIITGLNNGGAEAVLFRLCINDKIHWHTVVSLMDMGKYGPLLVEKGVEVHFLNMPAGRVTLCGLRKLYSLLKTTKPDAVQTWMYHADLIGGVVARLAGVKSVFWGIHHTTLAPSLSKRSTIFVAQLCAFLSRWVPVKIVCCANKAAEVHVSLGYKKDKIQIIANGYELDRLAIDELQCATIKNELLLDESPYVLGMVGRYDPMKDHTNLLAALSLVKEKITDFKCLLVGKFLSQNNKNLVNEINKFGLSDRVLLLEQRADIPFIMNALDVHVLSSCSEAFPNVLAEAMACGTPCVTTDVGDASLIVGDTGWVVPSRDPQALADVIIQAFEESKNLKNWQLRQKVARERIVEHFSIHSMIEKYHAVWKTLDL